MTATTADKGRTFISQNEVTELQKSFTKSMLRLEQYPVYRIDLNSWSLVAWLAGKPVPSNSDGWWPALVRRHIDDGHKIQRVRVLEDEPTPYQQWIVEMSKTNVGAGEDQRYIGRSEADRIGVTEAAGDWWLFDETTMVQYHVDSEYNALAELITDADQIVKALSAWNLIYPAAVAEAIATEIS